MTEIYKNLDKVISAVIGQRIQTMKEVVGGLRVAKVLWKLDSKFFDFFELSGRYSFGDISNASSQDIQLNRIRYWGLMIQSMYDYIDFDFSRSSPKFIERGRKFQSFFREEFMKEEKINDLLACDGNMTFFFWTIFTVFIQTGFSSNWKQMEDRMGHDLRQSFSSYLNQFNEDNLTEDGGNSRTGGQYSEEESKLVLLNVIKEKEETLYNAQVTLSENKVQLKSLQDEVKTMKYRLKMKDELASESRDQIRYLEMRVKTLEEDLFPEFEETSSIQNLRISFDKAKKDRDILSMENKDLRKDILYLKDMLKQREEELQDINKFFVMKSNPSGFSALKRDFNSVEDQCTVKNIRIEGLQEKIKILTDKLVKASEMNERLKGKTMMMNTKIVESQRKNVELVEKIKLQERKIGRLDEELNEICHEKIKVQQSNARLRHENHNTNQIIPLEDISPISCKTKQRLNMSKTMEEVALLYTEELTCLYSLLHDVFVNELTGESLQDLINKKLYEKDNASLRQIQGMVV